MGGSGGGVLWKFPSILQQVTVATETRSHAVQLTTEAVVQVVQVGLEVVARGIESNVLLCLCLHEYRRAQKHTPH